MKRVLTAAVLIPLVLLAVFRAPLWLFAVLVSIVAILATLEYLHIAEKTGVIPFRRLTLLIIGICLFLGSARVVVSDQLRQLIEQNSPAVRHVPRDLKTDHPFLFVAYEASRAGTFILLAFASVLLLLRGMRRQELSTNLPGAAVSSLSLVYIAFPLLSLVMIRVLPLGAVMLLYLFLVVWVGDVFAYYIGRTFGRHKLAPRISPGKTWEGAAASLISVALLGTWLLPHAAKVESNLKFWNLVPETSYEWYVPPTPLWQALVLSIIINIAAQLGDLVESALKRGAGLKDSGTLLPGHGGVLDRIDALLFAAPVLWYYATFRLIPF